MGGKAGGLSGGDLVILPLSRQATLTVSLNYVALSAVFFSLFFFPRSRGHHNLSTHDDGASVKPEGNSYVLFCCVHLFKMS